MKSKTYVFRVDASFEIGSGHVMRCLALADGLRSKGAVCVFVARAFQGNLNSYILSKGYYVLELPLCADAFEAVEGEPVHSPWRSVGWRLDATQTIGACAGIEIDWLIVDHYGIWKPWQTEVKKICSKIMVVDDLADRDHDCDLLLDQNFGVHMSSYENLVPSHCKTMLGPSNALLRPEFHLQRSSSLARRQNSPVKEILINFGGGDPRNYVLEVLKAFSQNHLPSHIKISIIVGSLSKITSAHQILIDALPNRTKCFESVHNMGEMLTNTDLVIGAAGSSSWERCCLGVPSIVFPIAANQIGIIKNLSDSGAVWILNDKDLNNGNFMALVIDLILLPNLNLHVAKAAEICDGKGVERLVGALNG